VDETDAWGTTTYYWHQSSRRRLKISHTIQADNPIGIEFIGYDAGEVNITSVGDVLINNNIRTARANARSRAAPGRSCRSTTPRW
jgi:hypothetical protein